MRTCSIMIIPQGFKIRKKSDIKIFIEKCMQQDDRYQLIVQDGTQMIIEKSKDNAISVSIRKGDLNDIFNPSIQVALSAPDLYDLKVEDWIWNARKYINKQWFNERRD